MLLPRPGPGPGPGPGLRVGPGRGTGVEPGPGLGVGPGFFDGFGAWEALSEARRCSRAASICWGEENACG